ncbi:hypothetical protein EDB84DRAFT_735333 [Lactarius hengduanensis]|nr:hypothetical protein EDB84DRAFT_735333 [Lactarius hengduanensis]
MNDRETRRTLPPCVAQEYSTRSNSVPKHKSWRQQRVSSRLTSVPTASSAQCSSLRRLLRRHFIDTGKYPIREIRQRLDGERIVRLFKIEVDPIDAATFFNTAHPTLIHLFLASFSANERRPQGPLAKSDRSFFHYLKDAMTGEESFVDDFAALIPHMFEYDEPERVIHQWKELSFVMCGMMVNAMFV